MPLRRRQNPTVICRLKRQLGSRKPMIPEDLVKGNSSPDTPQSPNAHFQPPPPSIFSLAA
ncbi:mCG1039037 [Mus musculus]|nr:mCG1039037 [Mus musculus]